MRINRALGLGIGILVLQFLMSEVFQAFEHTLVTTFNTTDSVLGVVQKEMNASTTSFASLIPKVPK